METAYVVINKDVAARKIITRQVLISSLPLMFAFMYGLSLGSPTVIIPQLRKKANSTEAVNDDMASWTSSIINFSGIAWVMFLVFLAHNYGRKKTCFFVNICSLLAFIYLYFSTNIMEVLISQAILGVTAATAKTISSMLVSELSISAYRGVFATAKVTIFFFGIWVSNALGAFFPWETIAMFGIVCSASNLIVSFFVPESPLWLASNGSFDECAINHRWLKGVTANEEKELKTLMENQHTIRNEATSKRVFGITYHFKTYWKIISYPGVYKPVLLSLLLCFLYDTSGKLSLTVYSIDMIKKITSSERTAYIGMLVLDAISLGALLFCTYLVKIMKRKTLLLSSSLMCIVFLYIMSLYLFLVKNSILLENKYISLSLLIAYSLSVCCGPVIMNGVITCELMPTKHRSVCFILVAICPKISIGIILKVTPAIFRAVGFHGVFLMFGSLCLITLYVVYKFLPETKDKTLDEITQLFTGSNTAEAKELLDISNRNKLDS